MPHTDDLKKTIVTALELGAVPQAEQDEITDAVSRNILDRLILSILEHLPDDTAREKFAAMAEAGDMTALKAFARAMIENFDVLMATEIQKEIAAHKNTAGE